MKKRVVFVVEAPFEERDYNRFGIAIIAQSHEVRVVDLSALLAPERYTQALQKGAVYKCEGYSVISGKAAALRELAAFSKEISVVFVVGYRLEALSYFRALSKSEAKIGSLFLGPLPPAARLQPKVALNPLSVLARKAKSLLADPSKLTRRIFNNLPVRAFGVRPYDFILASGESCLPGQGLVGPKTKPIWAHSLDYELCRAEFKKGTAPENSHIVFLDEYAPFHPDYLHLGIAPPCSAEEYYPKLNRLFATVEAKLGKPVVVAAHPRSRYETHPDYFEGRKVIRGKTPELVRDAALVIAHSSTAVSYAVLYDKPVLFTYPRSFEGRHEEALSKGMAEALSKHVLLLDELDQGLDIQALTRVVPQAYQDYQRRYIKRPGSPELPVWEIFVNYLKS